MTTSISARELFDQQKDKLALRWLAGLKGEKRELEAVDTVARDAVRALKRCDTGRGAHYRSKGVRAITQCAGSLGV